MGLTRYVGFYRGFDNSYADYGNEAEPSKPAPLRPGQRAEGGTSILPPSVYQRPPKHSEEPVTMLDSTPIQRPASRSSSSRSPRFREHMVEMEDTSSSYDRASSPSVDSPTLGRQSELTLNASLADDVRRRQHLMSWNNYDPPHSKAGTEDQMGATMGRRARPAARIHEQASPDMSGGTRDSEYVVSPLGSLSSKD